MLNDVKHTRRQAGNFESSEHLKAGPVEQTKTFQSAALEAGFIEVNESPEENVQWLRKRLPDPGMDTHQRICIDGLTKSATVYWMNIAGKIDSKTFRGVPALEEWIKSGPLAAVAR